MEEAGTQDIPQLEPSLFIQDKWQPNADLTISYGLRWEAQIQPDPITPPSEVFYAPLHRPARVSRRTAPSRRTRRCSSPGWASPGIRSGDGRQVVRFSTGLFYARIPGLSLASSRSTNGSRGQTLYRDSTFNGFGVTPPAWPNLIPQSADREPGSPGRVRVRQGLPEPAHVVSTRWPTSGEVMADLSAFVTYTHSDTDFITRFINRNDPVFGSPWSTGLGRRRHATASAR